MLKGLLRPKDPKARFEEMLRALFLKKKPRNQDCQEPKNQAKVQDREDDLPNSDTMSKQLKGLSEFVLLALISVTYIKITMMYT